MISKTFAVAVGVGGVRHRVFIGERSDPRRAATQRRRTAARQRAARGSQEELTARQLRPQGLARRAFRRKPAARLQRSSPYKAGRRREELRIYFKMPRRPGSENDKRPVMVIFLRWAGLGPGREGPFAWREGGGSTLRKNGIVIGPRPTIAVRQSAGARCSTSARRMRGSAVRLGEGQQRQTRCRPRASHRRWRLGGGTLSRPATA